MKTELTERQEEILTFIKQFRDENGYPPTLRQIGKRFDISSTFGVKRHLDALVKKGYINVESFASRGISLPHNNIIDAAHLFQQIPVVGHVAAGSPILAIENLEGNIVVDPAYIKKAEDCFALRVKGDSMINAGIFEGDLVIVSPKKEALNGEIVVARIDDEVTVKTFQKKNDVIKLIPENEKYKPIEIKGTKDFSIIGKVIGVIRWFN
jgi:repressor LexA